MKRYKPKSKKNGQVSALIRARRHKAHVSQVNRRKIIERDCSTCYMCGRKLSYTELVIDYVIPISRGGSHSEDNLAVACTPCNLRIGSKLPAECEWLNQSDGTLVIRASNK